MDSKGRYEVLVPDEELQVSDAVPGIAAISQLQNNGGTCFQSAEIASAGDSFLSDQDGDNELPPPCKIGLFVWMLLMSIPYGFVLLLCLTALAMSVMMFDSGVNSKTVAMFVFAVVLSLGVAGVAIVAFVSMWTSFNRKQHRRAAFLSCIPIALSLVMTLLTY